MPMHADVGLVTIATRCPRMRQLVVKDMFGVTNYGMEYISRHCPLLEVRCIHARMDL